MSHQKVTMRLILLKKRVFNSSERYKNLSKNSLSSNIFDYCLFILLLGEFKFLILLNFWYFPIAGIYCVYLPNNSKIQRKIDHGEIKRFSFKIDSQDLQITPLGFKMVKYYNTNLSQF